SAAKAGVIGMMNALSVPLAKRGIRVNVVAPGTTRTPLTEDPDDPNHFGRKAARIPLGRVGPPDDVAAVTEALADRMTYVAGETITIDGGHLQTVPPDPGSRDLRSRIRRRIRRLA